MPELETPDPGLVPPSLQADAARLEGLAPEEPSGEEVKVTFPGDEEPETAPSAPDDSVARLETATRQAVEAEDRLKDTQKSWHEKNQEVLGLQQQLAQYEVQRRNEQAAAEQLRALAPPTITEDDAADPAALAKKLGEVVQYVDQHSRATMFRPMQEMGQAVAQMHSMSSMGSDIAFERAEKEVTAAGFDVNDFREHREEIQQGFANIPNGAGMMMESGRLAGAYALLKLGKKEPLAVADHQTAPVVLGARAPRNEQAVADKAARTARIKSAYGSQFTEVLGSMGLKEVNLTESELDLLERGMQ